MNAYAHVKNRSKAHNSARRVGVSLSQASINDSYFMYDAFIHS